jgi:integrase
MEPTWTTAVTGWAIEQRAAGMAHSTIHLWRRYLRRLSRTAPTGPWTVTREHLITWLAEPSWSPTTRRSARTAIRSFYRWAVETGKVDASSSPAARLPKVRTHRGIPRPAPDDIIRDSIARASTRVKLMLMFAAFAGLRRGEISRVHTSDLDGRILRVHGKGGRWRIVPIPLSLAALIRAQPPGWVFPSCNGAHLSAPYVGKLMSRALPGKWTAHTLRHAAATAWADAGLDIDELAELLGHSSAEVTRVYKQISMRKLSTGVERASRRLTDVCPADSEERTA